MSKTVGETIRELQDALCDYVEATYHVSDRNLVEQRRELLKREGVIYRAPFVESTPRYQTGARFSSLGLDDAVLELFDEASKRTPETKPLIHDPPYMHQAAALKESLVNGKSLVVMTGTGSGKTECFLLPILGKLAAEAKASGAMFADTAAMRAMILYPMNALVNDQLGRLRLLFGDGRVVHKFMQWSGRPARFARYTSRTLYPGVRTKQRDQDRLKPIGKYFVNILDKVNGAEGDADAERLLAKLQEKGKWPAKPDLSAWYGRPGTRWEKSGAFKRANTLPEDSELLTRHEVHDAPPDVLVTNYSMLEYMLLRPLERQIFDKTSDWLQRNPTQRFLLVIDEAHLYRGASGTEVAMLIRRLRQRLGLSTDRLQVICTSASFDDKDYAVEFAAQLTGKPTSDFAPPITGDLDLRPAAAQGTTEDFNALAAIDLEAFHSATSAEERLNVVREFLDFRGVSDRGDLSRALHDALKEFPPMSELVNATMKAALPAHELGTLVFGGEPTQRKEQAVTSLMTLGSIARREADQPGLLPCRVHAFFRGLPGLWVCLDSQCAALRPELRGGPCGKLYDQPRDECDCGARVLELFTCRSCGAAYGRAYTDDVLDPTFLWGEAGEGFVTQSGSYEELLPMDLLLDAPLATHVEEAHLDLVTGRLNPRELGPRHRSVYIPKDRLPPPEADGPSPSGPGQFVPCAVCSGPVRYGRSSVQDHQTKGDYPFQAVVTRQIQVQPPGPIDPTSFAPLRGRKVLIFSDSRQMAARLAPNLQTYSMRDAVRPLVLLGYRRLKDDPATANDVSLEDLYLAVLLAARELEVRLRPALSQGESFDGEEVLANALEDGVAPQGETLRSLFNDFKSKPPPASLLRALNAPITDRYYGCESLALASIRERPKHTAHIQNLPGIPGIAQTPEQKVALARSWLRCWLRSGIWLSAMPADWAGTEVTGHKGAFEELNRWLGSPAAEKAFRTHWLPELMKRFTERRAGTQNFLRGAELTLELDGPWGYCGACRTTQRPFPGTDRCCSCLQPRVEVIDPDNHEVFRARKGYYRYTTTAALQRQEPPTIVVAAEHTAQLNAAHAEKVFSRAEENELLFQDVNIGNDDEGRERNAIDILSCTTTMEVGIDIGALSGVALRNMPPGRANYQQRAGRAGRRGNSIATVTAFASADSHDEHYFANPAGMIRGTVVDPRLTLDNVDIIRRHVTAYLLQRYHRARLKHTPQDARDGNLFAVLGSVSEFTQGTGKLTRADLGRWLGENREDLRREVASWLPSELGEFDRNSLLDGLAQQTLAAIDEALEISGDAASAPPPSEDVDATASEDESTPLEHQEEEGQDRPTRQAMAADKNLLDRLLYRGVLPRYAFPTDVVSFYVFDTQKSDQWRHLFHFAPSQSRAVGLTQYAPGKDIWIGGKLYSSEAIYSPIRGERPKAWEARQLYYECEFCHYAETKSLAEGRRNEYLDCPACGQQQKLGPARYWMIPPGFAHPSPKPEGTSPDDQPLRSYATRAKLTAQISMDQAGWRSLNDRIRVRYGRHDLLVTNRGPRGRGYTYCTICGAIAPEIKNSNIASAHVRPSPEREQNCPGTRTSKGIVLGTRFETDVLLISLTVSRPLQLRPGYLGTEVALRTLCDAIAIAACNILELEPGEIQAEFRPAVGDEGKDGEAAELYLYDTLPGGAGFSRRAGLKELALFRKAYDLLVGCAAKCQRSCYKCLRSYKNKFEHDLLDRYVAASLLGYVLDGTTPTLDAGRVAASTDKLFHDLRSRGIRNAIIERNHRLHVPNIGEVLAPIWVKPEGGSDFIVTVTNPLAPDFPTDERVRETQQHSVNVFVEPIDEILIHRHLPKAASRVMARIPGA